jgi:hypothetical protein
MFERKLTSFRKNSDKNLLRDYFNTKFGTNFTRITPIRNYYLNADANEVYNELLDEYNAEVERRQNKRKAEKAKQNRANKLITTNVKKFDLTISDNRLGDTYEILKKYAGKNIVVEYESNGKNIKNMKLEIPLNFTSWWRNIGIWYFQVDSETTIYDTDYLDGIIDIPQDENDMMIEPTRILYIYEANNNINYKKIKQVFKAADNGKCVFNPVRSWAENKYNHAVEMKNKSSKSRYSVLLDNLEILENKYSNGVDEDNIDEICNKLQIDISIEKPLCNKTFIECKSIKKALKHFRYLNTRINHVELNEYVLNEKPEIVSRKELLAIKKQLEEDDTYFTFDKDMNNVCKIYTLNKVYALNNEMMECFNQFEIDTGLINCKIDDIDDAELSSFIKHGTHYNGTIDFKNVGDYYLEDVFHIDMTKAYAQYALCDYYEGFLGKITDFRTTDKIEGVGLYYIKDLIIPEGDLKKLNDKMQIYISYNIYPSFELKFLEKNGCTFTIIAGCWGVKPLDFHFTDEMLNGKSEEGSSYYALWTGKCDSHYLSTNKWINGDYNMVQIIQEHTDAKIEKYENGEICVKYEKKHNYHLGHITSFITAYQRLNVLEMLMTIDYDNIIRVCVDGIYTEEEEQCFGSFRPKNDIKDKTFNNVAGLSYISNLMDGEDDEGNISDDKYRWFNFGKNRKHNHKELHIGAGGNGKTHRNLTDNGLVKILYISPSWKLARNKEEEYKSRVSVLARLITEDPEMISIVKRYSNVLLIDECSMMTEGQKQAIFNLYDDMKIIFCGDLGYQLGPCEYDICNLCKKTIKMRYCFDCNCKDITHIVPEEMNKEGFDEIIQNNTNYRCNDSRLLELLNDLRSMISYDRPTKEINSFVIDWFKTNNRCITIDTLKEIYNVNDMILVGTNILKDNYTEMFKELEKYYCKENNRLYSNGEIVIGKKPECKSELRHAYTTHSIQGETAYYKLFIDSKKMFNPRMFYTAISRAKTLEQIFII